MNISKKKKKSLFIKFTIQFNSRGVVRLIGITSPITQMVQVHNTMPYIDLSRATVEYQLFPGIV